MRIVADNYLSVKRFVNVGLNSEIGSVSRGDKRRIGIFGLDSRKTSVGNYFSIFLFNLDSVHNEAPSF
jgi:hypothetical protein